MKTMPWDTPRGTTPRGLNLSPPEQTQGAAALMARITGSWGPRWGLQSWETVGSLFTEGQLI